MWATVCAGTNQDGHAVTPMTAPSGEQQKKLLHSVYNKYHVDVSGLDYIEAHGTLLLYLLLLLPVLIRLLFEFV